MVGNLELLHLTSQQVSFTTTSRRRLICPHRAKTYLLIVENQRKYNASTGSTTGADLTAEVQANTAVSVSYYHRAG